MSGECRNCQYFREGHWCSNSQSQFYRKTLYAKSSGCTDFVQRGKKAPRVMLETIRIMSRLRKMSRKA